MAYRLSLQGTKVMAEKYFAPGSFTRRSSNGMKRWMGRQLEFAKDAVEVPALPFGWWLKLLKHKSIIIENYAEGQ